MQLTHADVLVLFIGRNDFLGKWLQYLNENMQKNNHPPLQMQELLHFIRLMLLHSSAQMADGAFWADLTAADHAKMENFTLPRERLRQIKKAFSFTRSGAQEEGNHWLDVNAPLPFVAEMERLFAATCAGPLHVPGVSLLVYVPLFTLPHVKLNFSATEGFFLRVDDDKLRHSSKEFVEMGLPVLLHPRSMRCGPVSR
jgi:hypothetical protein